MRTLQYIFDVLLYNQVIELEHDEDEEGNFTNARYTITGIDPFYIEDSMFEEMERRFNATYEQRDDTALVDLWSNPSDDSSR